MGKRGRADLRASAKLEAELDETSARAIVAFAYASSENTITAPAKKPSPAHVATYLFMPFLPFSIPRMADHVLFI
jgi:hypothetical protein